MRARSIGFELTAWYAAILAVTLAVTGIGVRLALEDSIHVTVDKELRGRLASVHAALAAEGAGATPPALADAAAASEGLPWRIADAHGAWLYQAPGTQDWGAAPMVTAPTARARYRTVTVRHRPIRVITAAWGGGLVQIGMSTEEFEEMLSAFTWIALLASPLLLLIASAGGYWMSRRALAPVEEIVRAAGEIEARNLAERLPARGSGDELDRLAGTLNAMLGRLEEAFARMRQFTADASHELRTPIAVIRTTAEVTRRRPRNPPEYEAALKRIQAASERSSELIEQLMLLARADSGADAPAREPVALAAVAHTACDEAQALADAAGVKLVTDIGAGAEVLGDASALRRLMLILLDNAIKYSHMGGTVLFRLQHVPAGGQSTAVLEIRDQGMGISAEDLPHVFQRFYRAGQDRSRDDGGAGLGLAIAQSIARQHQGELAIESQAGAGTTARLALHTTNIPAS